MFSGLLDVFGTRGSGGGVHVVVDSVEIGLDSGMRER